MREIAVLISCFALCACQSGNAGRTPAGLSGEYGAANAKSGPALTVEIDVAVDAAVRDGFAGQVAIMRGGALIYGRAAGYADLDGKIPVTDETIFHVASLTKYFTAVLALKAVEEGRLSLDDEASAMFSGTPLAKRDFTISDLLSHRSGLRSTYAAEEMNDPASAIDAIAAANKGSLKDGAFHYSNDGYDLIAILLERIYGEPYEAVFRRKLAALARLQRYGFWGEAALSDPRGRGQPLKAQSAALMKRNYGMIGSAGLLITAADPVQWEHALRSGAVLSDRALAELDTPRDAVSIGSVLYGSFLINSPYLGPAPARAARKIGAITPISTITRGAG